MNQSVPFGKRLRDERLRLKKNQTDFALKGGVTKKTQMLYEAGSRSPDADYLTAIEAAGADVTYLLTGVDAETRKRRAQQSRGAALARAKLMQELAPTPAPIASEEEALSRRAALHASAGLAPVNAATEPGQGEDYVLEHYRRCTPADQTLALQLLARLAAQPRAAQGGQWPPTGKHSREDQKNES